MLILKNARIKNVLDPKRENSVIAIQNGMILAVGGEEVITEYRQQATIQDMHGSVILPGITDAHIHLQHFAESLQKVNVETPTKEDALAAIALKVTQTPQGQWVFGHGFQHNDWGGDLPTRHDLDAISTVHPIYLTGKSLHLAWANTLALKMASIDPKTADPENGVIVREPGGQPSGILLESAITLFEQALVTPTTDFVANQIEQAQSELWRFGVTSVHDFDYKPAWLALQQLDIAGRLRLRVVKNIPVSLLGHATGLGLRTGFGSNFLKIGAVKVFMDGALGARTAAMLDGYEGEKNNHGILNMDGEEFFELGAQAADSGLAMTGHAIGDRAVHEILNGFERLREYERSKGYPRLRHRIEHVQLLHKDDVARLGSLGVIASMQPIHAISDMDAADKFWGNRVGLSYAWRSQLQHNATLAFGSDSPVESPNPFWGLYAAVSRKKLGQPKMQSWVNEQAIGVDDAIRAYTVGAAFAGNVEDRIGQLQPGYFADLIVLEKDPYTCEIHDLKDILPIATMVAGDWVMSGL